VTLAQLCWRSGFLTIAAFLVLSWSGCNRPAAPVVSSADRTQSIERSLDQAAHYLLSLRSAKGTWSSDTYGQFKDPAALTPLVAVTFQRCPMTPERQAAIDHAKEYLAGLVRPDGTLAEQLNYPYYTAPLAILLLADSDQALQRKACAGWVTFLRQRQLSEDLGWKPEDKEYGGWGYCPLEPIKPEPGKLAPPFIESNLSATLFTLQALRAAGVSADDPAIGKALAFVRRCQNFSDEPTKADPRLDDGGFFFIYDDPVRNKAGVVAGTEDSGRQRFYSYGSMTADGLRALRLCGLPDTNERVVAARRWLEGNFSATQHPGTYAKMHASQRNAVYYYYSASTSQAFLDLKLAEIETKTGKVAWAEALADEIMKRQRSDGSWENPVEAVRENDPIVCTCLAIRALANCRTALGRK
jgi:squalene-hopene/tetraprenyl-beta-curcumene cyclase